MFESSQADVSPHAQSSDDELLRSLNAQQAVIRDRVRGVADGDATGFYLYGRPGTSKTYTVRNTLEKLDRKHKVVCGYLTPLALFELLKEYSQYVLVLDDVGLLLKSERAMQILLAVLGGHHGSREPRFAEYRRGNDVDRVYFEGGLVVISNVLKHDSSLFQAFQSRIHCHQYDPSDEEIAALIRDIAKNGDQRNDTVLSPESCLEVAEMVFRLTTEHGQRLDLRTYFKAINDRIMYDQGRVETHWYELLRITVQSRLARPETDRGVRASRKDADQTALRSLLKEFPGDREGQIRAWTQRTGLSVRAFYRRLREIESVSPNEC